MGNLPVLPIKSVLSWVDGQVFCAPSMDNVCNLDPVLGSIAIHVSLLCPGKLMHHQSNL